MTSAWPPIHLRTHINLVFIYSGGRALAARSQSTDLHWESAGPRLWEGPPRPGLDPCTGL